MKGIIPNIEIYYRRIFVIFAVLALVLLSSCPIKSSLKSFAGLPAQTAQNMPQGKQAIALSTGDKCSVTSISEVQIIKNNSINDAILLPIIFLASSFLFLFSLCAIKKENKHPTYSRSSKISNSIPLFLAYRKLILHFSY